MMKEREMKIVREERGIGREERKKSVMKSLSSRETDEKKGMQVKYEISSRLCL